jgi:YegS/Rv2252/BmrU family lipid kinase
MPDPSITRIAILVNPKAGKGRAGNVLSEVLKLAEDFDHTIFTTIWPESFKEFSDVFLIGGDGTLNYFINQYPGISLPITLFKGGSGNDFAWKLYGNISVRQQFLNAINAKPKNIDAGICNGKLFLNGVGIGFDGSIVKSMGEKRFISAGFIAYLWTVIKHLFFYKEEVVEIKSGNFYRKDRLFMVTIANGSRYGGGFMVSPESVINDGLLEIISIGRINPIKRIFYLPAMMKGKHLKEKLTSFEKGVSVRISSQVKLAAHCDGELKEDHNFDITILPGRFLFRY